MQHWGNQMELTVICTADWNDGDCITQASNISVDDLPRLVKIAEAIKAKGKNHNWENGEQGNPVETYAGILSEEDVEWFDQEIAPYQEYGIHTITSIEYHPSQQKTKIL